MQTNGNDGKCRPKGVPFGGLNPSDINNPKGNPKPEKNLILEVNFIHPVRRRNIRLIHW